MSGKLDQSLDEIATAQRRNAGRRRSARRTDGRPAAPPAPVGGVKKNTRAPRAATKAPPAKGAPVSGDSKIIVSNLPKDVTEKQIKDYFNQSVGGIKRVEISYGPNSQSRGIANITFSRADGASTAFSKLNGLLVDGKPIKIEIVVGAAHADKVIPKTLAERASQPKSQPKSAANGKPKTNNAKAAPAAKGAAAKQGRRARNARPAKKTAEELDSDMADYFTTSGAAAAADATGATAAAAPAAATGDAAMEDEIM